MTETAMTEAEFRTLLAAQGLHLDPKAFQAALQGARHLRAQIAQLDAYLADLPA
ncbi:MAG: hypothetical protein H7317_04600 [Pseudorhodobacter sp.]|nr:hypothetical protein [Pseudorhodobacter sp.]